MGIDQQLDHAQLAVKQGQQPAGIRGTLFLLAVLAFLVILALGFLLSVEDPVRLKLLIEDDGPVQSFGQAAIALAFGLALFFTLADKVRRRAYLYLSYLLMFYTLREADYHYELSDYAKATQFKRFFFHELIPFSSKLFLFSIVVLFLMVMVTYLRENRAGFTRALQLRLPWALVTVAWSAVFGMSQLIDQLPWFHNVSGQVFEEVFECTAEVLVLLAMLLFRVEVRATARPIH